MKALTIWQPYSDQILDGTKTVENRNWDTSYRGPLIIHAGKRAERGHEHRARGALGLVVLRSTHSALSVSGWCGCTSAQGAEQGSSIFHWVLSDPLRFVEPIPMSGRQQLFAIDVPAEAIVGIIASDWKGWAYANH